MFAVISELVVDFWDGRCVVFRRLWRCASSSTAALRFLLTFFSFSMLLILLQQSLLSAFFSIPLGDCFEQSCWG